MPLPCRRIGVNAGYCVTVSDDKFLRVWPLDFSDYFLEAKHEGAIGSVDVSPDAPGGGVDVDEEALARHPAMSDAKSGIWSSAAEK